MVIEPGNLAINWLIYGENILLVLKILDKYIKTYNISNDIISTVKLQLLIVYL